jgi:uncharacterized protein
MKLPLPRVVLDTNVVLSAALFARGRLSMLRSAWHDVRFCPLASTVTITELIRVLAYPKFKLNADDQRELLADYLPYCAVVQMPATPPTTPPCPDPFDVPFLELAVAGKADFLVTGDKDLIGLKLRNCAIAIADADEFMRALAIKPA